MDCTETVNLSLYSVFRVVGSPVQLSLVSSYIKINTEVKDPESVPYSDSVGFVFCESLSQNAAAALS